MSDHGTPAAGTMVSKEVAQKAALDKVAGGKVKDGKLEKYKGKTYRTFDIATEGSKQIAEVAVDPKTGRVVWQGKEDPNQ